MNEQISALLDDEIAAVDATHIITSIQMNKQAADAWSRYHLIGDAIRGTSMMSADFKQNLMQKIDLEATVLSPTALMTKSMDNNQSEQAKNKIPFTWSIAASFAAVTLVGWMMLHQQIPDGLTQVEVAQNTTKAIDKNAVVDHTVATIPEEYLMAHQASVPSGSSYYIQTVGYSGQ